MVTLTWRSKTLLSLIAFVSIFVFAASPPWDKFWLVLLFIFSLFLMFDVLFVTPRHFDFDPFYSNWEARQNDKRD
ncbi:hypothetical protein BBBOND_0101810 [Babesia bigemina]|uniref:Transmembrane protein n=1 Tax=Babesia bigemina TaxID=5866 RepID=A0A061D177_BABBI|nr:hypothetical protein BBBOND_0101810 [Babesia bigemina]CDR93852.1 hypothetical protein BBBOND_0101810 [Babesia bigemina]|eukprot:XP_012766038.1 hypothetical protein BBBOND_0101810 [Babesia bigemina]